MMSSQIPLTSLPIDLYCHSYRGEPPPFKLEVYPEALLRLIDDAKHGLRIYELFAIKRPGDIKKYLWVMTKDVPTRVGMLYLIAREKGTSEYVKCTWPENECPYDVWDNLFYASWDDNPEDSAWLDFKDSDTIHHYLDLCFTEVKQTQQWLKDTGDLLIKNEIKHIESLRHGYDYGAHTPFKLTKRLEPAAVWERQDEAYYPVLEELLANPDITSVAYRYGEDYRTFRMICAEQQHRVMVTSKNGSDVMRISVLSNGLPSAEPWGCDVTFYDEGLAYGDLFIDLTDGSGCNVKELCEEYGRHPKYILTLQDFGQIKQYKQAQRDGVFIYSRLDIKEQHNGKDK